MMCFFLCWQIEYPWCIIEVKTFKFQIFTKYVKIVKIKNLLTNHLRSESFFVYNDTYHRIQIEHIHYSDLLYVRGPLDIYYTAERFNISICLKIFDNIHIFLDYVKHIDAVLGDKAELPCNVQTVKNSTEPPILIIWYRGQDYPIYSNIGNSHTPLRRDQTTIPTEISSKHPILKMCSFSTLLSYHLSISPLVLKRYDCRVELRKNKKMLKSRHEQNTCCVYKSHIASKFSYNTYIFKDVKLKFTPLDIQPKTININSKPKFLI
ncbi:hypothetical protein AGLY_008906 [Aphis glycines]|uniref:Ig-like domain-containing protein n=1 Tax=Aphis glycines TaxID=307491 RepID=A0A6G0TJ05_APHGL|nr:hypothetical protein AGLY_008906 [Aphis glycines]